MSDAQFVHVEPAQFGDIVVGFRFAVGDQAGVEVGHNAVHGAVVAPVVDAAGAEVGEFCHFNIAAFFAQFAQGGHFVAVVGGIGKAAGQAEFGFVFFAGQQDFAIAGAENGNINGWGD